MYSLTFQNMIGYLRQADPPSSPMLVQSPTTPFRNLVNTMRKVPLSSSPLSPFILQYPETSSLHKLIGRSNLASQSRETSPIDDTPETSFDDIIEDHGGVSLSLSSPVSIPGDLVQSAPVHPPSTSSFEALVRCCSERYQATHGESDGNSSPDCSQDGDFEPELDQHFQIPTHSPADNEDQGQVLISREHIAS